MILVSSGVDFDQHPNRYRTDYFGNLWKSIECLQEATKKFLSENCVTTSSFLQLWIITSTVKIVLSKFEWSKCYKFSAIVINFSPRQKPAVPTKTLSGLNTNMVKIFCLFFTPQVYPDKTSLDKNKNHLQWSKVLKTFCLFSTSQV